MAVAAAGISVGVASAATTPSIKFSKIQYNSPGTDDRSTTSLNGEWVRLTNMTGKSISIKGWTIKDAAGHKYTFGTYSVPAYGNAYVHTGKGTDGKPDSQHRYWQSGNYIWNNDGDTATLRNASGTTIHSCKWGSSGSVTYCGTTMPPKPTAPASTKPTIVPTTTRPTAQPTVTVAPTLLPDPPGPTVIDGGPPTSAGTPTPGPTASGTATTFPPPPPPTTTSIPPQGPDEPPGPTVIIGTIPTEAPAPPSVTPGD